MRAVDTSAWIEILVAGPVSLQLLQDVPSQADWVMPTIVQLEIWKWMRRERTRDFQRDILAFSTKCLVVPLDTPIAIEAADLCAKYKLSTADAIILATAHAMNADLLICDAHFEGLPSVVYRAKAG